MSNLLTSVVSIFPETNMSSIMTSQTAGQLTTTPSRGVDDINAFALRPNDAWLKWNYAVYIGCSLLFLSLIALLLGATWLTVYFNTRDRKKRAKLSNTIPSGLMSVASTALDFTSRNASKLPLINDSFSSPFLVKDLKSGGIRNLAFNHDDHHMVDSHTIVSETSGQYVPISISVGPQQVQYHSSSGSDVDETESSDSGKGRDASSDSTLADSRAIVTSARIIDEIISTGF